MNWNYPLRWNIHSVYKGKRWLCARQWNTQISQLYGETPLKLYCISIVRETNRLSQNWLLWQNPLSQAELHFNTACLTEAPLRVSSHIHPKLECIFAASSTAESFRNDTEHYHLLSSWVAITAEVFIPLSSCPRLLISGPTVIIFLSCTNTVIHGGALQSRTVNWPRVKAVLCPCVGLPIWAF